jgi:hypothetical protein
MVSFLVIMLALVQGGSDGLVVGDLVPQASGSIEGTERAKDLEILSTSRDPRFFPSSAAEVCAR